MIRAINKENQINSHPKEEKAKPEDKTMQGVIKAFSSVEFSLEQQPPEKMTPPPPRLRGG